MNTRKKAVVELPPDQGWIDAWKLMLDVDHTPIKKFIEFYKVPTKRHKQIVGKTMMTKFEEYPLQTKQREAIEAEWKLGRGGKLASGKGRQEGMTTDAMLLLWERFMRGGGGTGNFFSYGEKPTKEGFRLLQSFKKQTPPWVFAHLINGGGGEWRRSSSMQLELVFPDGSSSMLQCLTAGKDSSGAGSSPRWLLWDEFPKWDAKVKADPTSMSEGWADVGGNWWIIQGTGMGNEQYAEFFMSVWNEQATRRHESGFVAIFPDRGWLGHKDRREEFESQEQHDALMERIGREKSFGVADELALVAAGAVPEELLWRRRKIASPSIKWDLGLFKREYPLAPNDMFESSARSVFTGQIEILRSHERPALLRERAASVGELVLVGDGGTEFIDSQSGPLTVFERPAAGESYCFGLDPSQGKAKLAASNREADFTVGSFKHVHSGRTVARLRGHLTFRVAAEELFKACCWYGGAIGFVESNIGKALISLMEDKEHGDWVGSDFLLKQDPVVWADGRVTEGDVGYNTSLRTRDIIIAAVEERLVEVGMYDESRGTPLDHMLVAEALVFERDDHGRPQAARGHDDCVFAEGLAELARRKILREGLVKISSKTRIPAQFRDPLEQQIAEESQRREDKRVLTIDPEAARRGVVKHVVDKSRSFDPALGVQFAWLVALVLGAG